MAQPTESTYLRSIPSVDSLLRTTEAVALAGVLGLGRVTALAREITDEMRREIRRGRLIETSLDGSRQSLLDYAVRRLQEAGANESLGRIRRVINGTGVILHTNLGRAPLSQAARKAIESAAGYCTVEYDASTGSRGKRGANVEKLLKQLTGAEDALVVNNGAAAALLILKVLAAGGETIVSRGELVEIGGDFRVPDVMANSGTRMREVGSTNRTRLDDYRNAITPDTRLIMRVHPSNFRIVGFTTTPTLAELAKCAHDANLFLYEDAGSGVLFDLGEFGVREEPIIKDCLGEGADVVSFSGDKLLGAGQAGIIVGRTVIIERLRKHALYRALRADKLSLAALEATLDSHARGESFSEVPALEMLRATPGEIEARARQLIESIAEDQKQTHLQIQLLAGESAIGGGCGPDVQLPTVLIGLTHNSLSADELEGRLRSAPTPVIARVANGSVLIDLRTVSRADEPDLVAALRTLETA